VSPASIRVLPGFLHFSPQLFDAQTLRNSHDWRNSAGEFFYGFVRTLMRFALVAVCARSLLLSLFPSTEFACRYCGNWVPTGAPFEGNVIRGCLDGAVAGKSIGREM
jgi:hypothetical protein